MSEQIYLMQSFLLSEFIGFNSKGNAASQLNCLITYIHVQLVYCRGKIMANIFQHFTKFLSDRKTNPLMHTVRALPHIYILSEVITIVS